MWDGGRKKGTKSDARDLARMKIRRLARNEVRGEKIGMQGYRRNSWSTEKLMDARIDRVSSTRGWAKTIEGRSRRTSRDVASTTTVGIFLTLDGFLESASRAKTDGHSSREALVVQNRALVEHVECSTGSTKYTVTEFGAIVAELLDNGVHVWFKSGGVQVVCIGRGSIIVFFFAEGVDAALKRATTISIGVALPELRRRSGSTRQDGRDGRSSLTRTVGARQIGVQGNGKSTGRETRSSLGIKAIHARCLEEIGGMETIVHEGAKHGRGVQILDVVHKNCAELDGFGKLSVKVKDSLVGFLVRPVQTKSDGMFNKSRVRIAENS